MMVRQAGGKVGDEFTVMRYNGKGRSRVEGRGSGSVEQEARKKMKKVKAEIKEKVNAWKKIFGTGEGIYV